MSKYKTIKTEYRVKDSLVSALREMGLTIDVSPANDLQMIDWFGHISPDRVAIRIKKDEVVRVFGHSYEGVGFIWNETERRFDVMESTHEGGNTRLLEQLRQRYAIKEITRVATRQGYRVQAGKLGQTVQVGQVGQVGRVGKIGG